MASDYTQYSSRIGDSSSPIGWQAACQGVVTDWTKTNHFVFAFVITCSAHTPPSETFKVQWSKNQVDWYDVGTSDIVVGSSDELNEGDPVGDLSGCAGASPTDSEEDESDNLVTIQVGAKNDYGEIQIALDPSSADDNTTYYFRLYSTTEAAALTTATATLTTAAAAQELSKEVTDTIALGDSQKKSFGKQLSETLAFADSQPKSLSTTLSEALSIVESKIKGFLKPLTDSLNIASSTSQSLGEGAALSQTVTDIITFVDSQRKNISKTVSDVLAVATSKIKGFFKSVADTLNIGSSTSQSLGVAALSQTVTDIITFADSHLKNVGKTVSDTLGFTTSKIKGLTQTVSDTLHLSDSKQGSLSKVLADVLNLGSSTVQRLVGNALFATVSDTIAFVENQIKNVTKEVSDILSIVTSQSFLAPVSAVIADFGGRFLRRKIIPLSPKPRGQITELIINVKRPLQATVPIVVAVRKQMEQRLKLSIPVWRRIKEEFGIVARVVPDIYKLLEDLGILETADEKRERSDVN